MEKHENREELKTAGKHVEDENALGEGRKASEVSCRSDDFAQARTHVVEAGEAGRKRGYDVAALDGNEDCGTCEDKKENHEVNENRTGEIVIDNLALEGYLTNDTWMNAGCDFLADVLDHDYDT